ncbi:unnamed protein product [Orchesella dallaii]|uniref:Uncharacterized protein n=1 Tax=Orchesella dallaii TaxID=48710 RepID=A0ABP1RI57_9HEXA
MQMVLMQFPVKTKGMEFARQDVCGEIVLMVIDLFFGTLAVFATVMCANVAAYKFAVNGE